MMKVRVTEKEICLLVYSRYSFAVASTEVGLTHEQGTLPRCRNHLNHLSQLPPESEQGDGLGVEEPGHNLHMGYRYCRIQLLPDTPQCQPG